MLERSSNANHYDSVLQNKPLYGYAKKYCLLNNSDKKEYDRFFGVTHSAAYTVYGCKRTGCAACPFGSRFEQELEMLRKYEPKLYKAAYNVFRESIEYTRAYRKYKSEHSGVQTNTEQLTLDDLETSEMSRSSDE